MLRVDAKTGEVTISPYSKFMHESVGLDTGSMIIQNYDFAWDDAKRDFKIVEGDKEDRQAYIDSFADDCGVYNILKKYSLTGDASLLNQREGFYGDITDLPVDELNVNKVQASADSSLARLNSIFGTQYTAEEFSQLTGDDIQGLFDKLVVGEVEVKKEEVKDNA